MNATPTTRPRHALRWVLGVGLVFVVVVVMALQAAQNRADERWNSVVTHWDEAWQSSDVLGPMKMFFIPPGPIGLHGDNSGGNIFRAWRTCEGLGPEFSLGLRQERNLLGTRIEARMIGGAKVAARDLADLPPLVIEEVRTIFAAVDVELIVEP